MDTPNSSLREQGVQALREGNLDGAVDLLARAVMTDGQDAEAQAFLGVAYSQKGLHAQAKRALQTAIALRPQEARFQFNLGVALQNAGDLQGAAAAFQETLRLNPEHAQAQSRLQSLDAQSAAPGPAAAAPSQGAAGPGTASPFGQPDASAARPTWMAGQQQASVGAAPAAPPGAPWLAGQQSGAAAGPPGTVQCPNCKQWSRPGLSCEWCSGSLRAAGAGSSAPGGYGTEAGGYRYEEDSFNLVQACKDWFQVLVSPRRFFQDQEGRDGLKAPLAFLLVESVFSVVSVLPLFLTLGAFGLMMVPFILIAMVLSYPFTIALMFIWAGIVHGVCRIFGGEAGYIGTFRIVTYALAPWLIIYLVSCLVLALTTPRLPMGSGPGRIGQSVPTQSGPHYSLSTADARSGSPDGPVRIEMAQYRRPGLPSAPSGRPGVPPFGAPNPMAAFGAGSLLLNLLNLVGTVYYMSLIGIGAFHVHRVSTGAAVGVAVVSGLVVVALIVMSVVLVVGLFAAIFAGMNAPGS